MNLLVVSAIARRDGRILMVFQGSEDERHWFIPGGVVEDGELLTAALERELLEETGAILDGDVRLAYITQVYSVPTQVTVTAFVFEVGIAEGDLLPDDPDTLIHDAAFVDAHEALERARSLPWASMREPLIAHLSGKAQPGAVWQYVERTADEFELVHRSG